MSNKKAIAYYRVSTQRQGRSGLGLDAQRAAVRGFTQTGDWDLIAEYTEVESGKRSDRPQLAAALAACRLRGATLIIAKLDRLARNVSFVAALMDSGAEFCAVDMPQANRFTVHIMAALAEHERDMISARTKAALAQVRARGKQLGGDRAGHIRSIAVRGRIESAKVRKESACRRADDLRPIIAQIEGEGTVTLMGIAAKLNEMKVTAPRGGAWGAGQVARVKRQSA